ncbi:MAG: hypothetical protein U0457_10115 [Candidatus Sericytochromatia bacterium]
MIKKLLLSTLLLSTFSSFAYAEEKTEKNTKPSFSGVNAYTRKLSLNNSTVSLGGYFDTEYVFPFGKNSFFDQHRLVLQASSLYNDRLFFNTEIEIEHGGISDENKGEVAIEQAFLDYKLINGLNLRTGIVLITLGRLNVYHDSDLRQTTSRPLFNRYIVPTTWSEPAAGLYGSISPDDSWELSYDLYVSQGLIDKISEEDGIKEAKPSLFSDNNNDKALSGRIGFSPFLGLEAGLGGYVGKVDKADSKYLGMGVADFKYSLGAFELLGEGGMVFMNPLEIKVEAENKDQKETVKTIKNPMYGYYGEARYKLAPDFLKMSFLGEGFDNPTITLFGRVDQIDTDMTILNGNDKMQFTLGFNYRPITNVVFKFEYQMNKNLEALLKNDPSKQTLKDQFLISAAAGF